MLLLLFVLLLFAPPAFAAEARCAGIDYQGLRHALIIREDWQNGEVYVNRRWYRLPLHDKKVIAAYLQECISKRNDVTILDGFTGRQLGRYRARWGYVNNEAD